MKKSEKTVEDRLEILVHSSYKDYPEEELSPEDQKKRMATIALLEKRQKEARQLKNHKETEE